MGNHPQENLAKFDYRLEMKIGKFKNPFTFWLFVENCCRFWQIYFKKSKSIELGSFVSKKSFVCVDITFFRWKKCKNSCSQKTLDGVPIMNDNRQNCYSYNLLEWQTNMVL